MKYFRIFNNTSEYTEYMASSSAITPNVAYCHEGHKSYIATGVKRVTGVTISHASAKINTNQTFQLTATVLPPNATDKTVTWLTSDSDVATVDTNGLVRGISSG